jgi:hypothetical protein
VRLDRILDGRIADRHFTRDVAEQAGAEGDEDRKALHQLHDERAAEQHERDRDHHSDEEHAQMAARSACHAQDVVQAHHDVRDDDGLHCGPEAAHRLRRAVLLLLTRCKQLDADPQQKHAADVLQIGKGQQVGREGGQHRHQDDDSRRADRKRLLLLLEGQVAARERDDDGVVAAQKDVDDADLKQRDPRVRLAQ